jgi:site-specific recombinase XerD
LDSSGCTGDELTVNKADILAFIRHMQEQKNKSNYQLKVLANLSSFYKSAVKQGWCLLNPMDGIEFPRKSEDVPIVLSVAEMKNLLLAPNLNMVDEFRDRCMMELAYSSALRRHEVTSVTLGQFSPDYRTVRVQGKGGKEAVTPVTRLCAHFLEFYMGEIWPYINKHNSKFLFLSVQTGKPLTSGHMNDIVKKYGKKSGLEKHLTSHIFRFSIATHLGESGVDIRYIQEFLRHNSMEATVRYIQQGFRHLQEIHRKTHPRGES